MRLITIDAESELLNVDRFEVLWAHLVDQLHLPGLHQSLYLFF